MIDKLFLKGRYPLIQHIRDGEIIGEYAIDNAITNVGRDYLLNVMFNGTTQTAAGSWVIGLIDASGFSALNNTDTMASHGTWTEWTSYSETARVPWGQGTSSGQTVTNGSPAIFDMTAAGSLQGIFVTTNGTKGGTTGTLWATGTFSAAVPVAIGDQLKITYGVAA